MCPANPVTKCTNTDANEAVENQPLKYCSL